MCNNFPNIRITEGNNFSIILPLLSRTYVATRPIDEEINPEQLQNVAVTFGGVSYPVQLTERGVQINLPATLAVGTYNILLTAEYLGSSIRAAYESAVTIVPWSEQSTAEQYIAGSPIVLRAAYVLSGALTDAELEALKEEYREKNAQLEQAIADAEAAKREWEEKAADLDGVAQQGDNPEATNTAILEAVQQGGGTDIAKESTSQQILTKIGSPAQGQGADLFAAMRDIALSATTLQELADAWAAMVTNRNEWSGYTFDRIINSAGEALACAAGGGIVNINDSISTEYIFNAFFMGSNKGTIKKVSFSNIYGAVSLDAVFYSTGVVEEFSIPNASSLSFNNASAIRNVASIKRVDFRSITTIAGQTSLPLSGCPNLIDVELGAITHSFSQINGWSPTNALKANSQTLLTPEDIAAGFTSNLEKLLYNIREHIAANLPVAPNTITFSAAVKAAILADQPTADAFTNKNWTIA